MADADKEKAEKLAAAKKRVCTSRSPRRLYRRLCAPRPLTHSRSRL